MEQWCKLMPRSKERNKGKQKKTGLYKSLWSALTTMLSKTLTRQPVRSLSLLPSFFFSRFTSSNPHIKTDKLKGKVALITGAGQGIGRATCIVMAEQNARIAVADINDNTGRDTAQYLNDTFGGDTALFVHMDVSDSDSVRRGIDSAEAHFGSLNVVFNNAGIMHTEDDNAVTTSDAVWDVTFNINVKGVFYGCKHGIPGVCTLYAL